MAHLAADIAALSPIVEVLQFREDTILYRVAPSKKETGNDNDLATQRNETYLQRYDAGTTPIAQFATEGGPGIQGKLSLARRGAGASAKTAPRPRRRALPLHCRQHDARMAQVGGRRRRRRRYGLVADNFLVKHRLALGDLEERNWETVPTGVPRDPWSKAYRALLIELSPPHGDVTFSGTSYGTELASRRSAGAYAAERSQHPGAYPVVELATAPWTSKHYGKQIRPDFPVVGWATVEDVRAGRKAQAAARQA